MDDQLKDKPKDVIKDLAKAIGYLAIIGVICVGLVALFLLFAQDRAKLIMAYYLVNNTNENLLVYNYEEKGYDIPIITSKKKANDVPPSPKNLTGEIQVIAPGNAAKSIPPYPPKNLAPGDTLSFYICPSKLKDNHVPEYWLGAVSPKFSGDIHKFLESHINYPQDAIDSDIQGTVYLTFAIEKDGEVKDVKVLRGVYPSLDSEAVRVARLMPKWDMKDTKLDSNYAGVKMALPIRFILK